MAERSAKTVQAGMIEGKHVRCVDARRRSRADAIDHRVEEEVSGKRADTMRGYCLSWRRRRHWRLTMSDMTPAAIAAVLGVAILLLKPCGYRFSLGSVAHARETPPCTRCVAACGASL